ncbi:hypothetical protein MKZ38_010112 [Zalerion maritima]|uniref:Biogenesis of lysosome-related organelles complex 1 subunit CNL1 n=1 Tax=Zalerion maritima TaxID=339359 RepID=A0AAD5RU04_9PEZI|nr:hypothetical protein MKZ38_010112 [Zalerion maritima]
MPSSSQANNAVPDTTLGLSADEINLLRYHQQQAANGSSSSRAASRASSQGLLLLDSSSLSQLSRYLDRLLQRIQQQIEHLSQQAEIVTMQTYDRAGNLVDNADAEIARYQEINAQLDELELDFDKIAHIKEIVKGYRRRVENLDRELDTSGSTARFGGAGTTPTIFLWRITNDGGWTKFWGIIFKVTRPFQARNSKTKRRSLGDAPVNLLY